MSTTANGRTPEQVKMLERHAELVGQYAGATAGVKAGLSRSNGKIRTLELEMWTSGLRPFVGEGEDRTGDFAVFEVPTAYTKKYVLTEDDLREAIAATYAASTDSTAPETIKSTASDAFDRRIREARERGVTIEDDKLAKAVVARLAALDKADKK
jgi:hypothetical protein